MAKFFGNLHLVLLVGLALAVVMILTVGNLPGGAPGLNQIFRWLHVFFGITWIGLLYYFNFVQIPTMPTVPAELKPGVSKYIAPKALFFFRWGALLTVLTGLGLAGVMGYTAEAFTLKPGYRLIGIGMWLALIMAANVWFVIWPNQQKALNIGDKYPSLDAPAKAAAAAAAGQFSRINTMLSIPMLFCMAGASHLF